eukprot:CAMPEP_0197640060 /NCGR_PEP_ID=MMETSP1338-20131121/14477_1 /TAXON_ID=43686 ORGANISM="Pelagodinium beii, Strain RCC1491" /NCGR_SAMPLE_ID=MMETSP1338 /ASSEMBLY_ACC=CAM_ASM_000754 /LENGTH=592 /DNA_ID=CAMNT_0043212867 /DNA_START=41 /DNA_END=1819 /DNA_ORIENTATION=+
MKEEPEPVKLQEPEFLEEDEGPLEAWSPSTSGNPPINLEGDTPLGEFVAFAAHKWDIITGLFLDDQYNQFALGGPKDKVGGAMAGRCLSKKIWVQELKDKLHYKGNAAAAFDQIVKFGTDEQTKQLQTAGVNDQETICLVQLRRFEARTKAASRHLSLEHESSPVGRLTDILRKRRGCLLRSWRLDLDKKGAGLVTYFDFSAACRELTLQKECKLAWVAMRPTDDRALEFADLAPDEAANLENFCDILWEVAGFDENKAWQMLDVNKKNKLDKADWTRSVRALGFQGDAALLFKGLTTSGVGWIWKEEFAYLLKVSKTGRKKLQRSGPLVGLKLWAQREFGGPEKLLEKVGLGDGNREITVCDLAARLTALGFEGDAQMCAVRAARTEGGTHVTAEALYACLVNDKKKVQERPDPVGPQTPLSHLTKTSSLSVLGKVPKTQRVTHAKDWQPHVVCISEVNTTRSKHTRNYFQYTNSLGRDEQVKFNPPARKAPGNDAGKVDQERPGWDNSGVTPETFKSSKQSRRYFSDFQKKPIRDEIRSSMANRRAQSETNLHYSGENGDAGYWGGEEYWNQWNNAGGEYWSEQWGQATH